MRIDADDIADAAVAALTEDEHAGHLYELTGPCLLIFAEAIHEIATATGRTIHYRQVAPQQFVDALAEQQVPDEYAWLLRYLFSTVLDGRNAHSTDGAK